MLAGVVFEGAFYSRALSIPFSLSVTKFFSKHNNFKFNGFIIMFSFFVTGVAEGAEGPSSGFEVIGRELAELDEGRSQEAMLHNHTILIHHKQNYFIQQGLGRLVFEGALYLSARSNQGNTVSGVFV